VDSPTNPVPALAPGLPVWIRFVVAGAANTAASLAVYQGALFFVDHVFAYVLGYAAGIAIAYYTYSRHVFAAALSMHRLAAFAGFYLASLAVGAALNWLLIERAGLHARLAVFATVAVMLPLNYYGSRWCVRRGAAA